MRRICSLAIIALLLFAQTAIADSWTSACFDFRDTSAFVTDPSSDTLFPQGCTYVRVTDNGADGDFPYPITRNLNGSGLQTTFGTTCPSSDNRRDRNALTGDQAVMAGMSFANNNAASKNEFRLLLPSSGAYNVRMAIGDYSNTRSNQKILIVDSDHITVLKTITAASVTATHFVDATGTDRTSPSDWVTNNQATSVTFSGTTAYIQWGYGDGLTTDLTALAHVSFTKANVVPTLELCGNGYDDLGSGNTFGSCPAGWHDAVFGGSGCDRDCEAIDPTFNGYTTDGSGLGKGCSTNDRRIFPGTYQQGTCSAGQYNQCKVGGSYSSCTTLSSFTAKTGSGSDFWVSPTGSTSGGCGAFGSPCDITCISNTGAACYHAPQPGDAIILRGGSYTSTWSAGTKMVLISSINGTAANPILMIGAPGESAVIVGQGTDPTEVLPIELDSSSYWKFQQFEIKNGFSNSGIYINGGSNVEVVGMKIHDIDGFRNSNVACVKTNGGTNVNVHHNLFYDCYDRAANGGGGGHQGSQGNSRLFVSFGGSTTFNWNVAFFSPGPSSVLTGDAVVNKHGSNNGGEFWNVQGNIVYGSPLNGIITNNPNSTVQNNIVTDIGVAGAGPCFGLFDSGGSPYYINEKFLNNTGINCWAYNMRDDDSSAPVTDQYFQGNVIVHNGASHSSDGAIGDIRLCNYCSDATYTAQYLGGLLHMDHNCFYETVAANPFYDVWGDAGSGSLGSTYTTLAALQAATTLEVGSVQTNPSLDYKQDSAVAGCTRGRSSGLYPAAATQGSNNTGGTQLLYRYRRHR